MHRPVVFFDMDGVLADFVGGACKAHGKHIPPAEVCWDFMTQIGFTASDSAFWDPLSNVDFWANLPLLSDGLALFRLVERVVGQNGIGILSSGLCPGSCDGKRLWLDKHLPGYGKRAAFCTAKEICAAPCKTLIDDHEPNAEKFRLHGGQAVLVPRPWNSRRSETCQSGMFDPDRLAEELSCTRSHARYTPAG